MDSLFQKSYLRQIIIYLITIFLLVLIIDVKDLLLQQPNLALEVDIVLANFKVPIFELLNVDVPLLKSLVALLDLLYFL